MNKVQLAIFLITLTFGVDVANANFENFDTALAKKTFEKIGVVVVCGIDPAPRTSANLLNKNLSEVISETDSVIISQPTAFNFIDGICVSVNKSGGKK